MNPLVFSASAVDDLERILRFIARDKPGAATRFVDAIRAECVSLQRNPRMGETRESLAPGLRRYCFRSYSIYFRELDEAVRIERVLHGAKRVGDSDFPG